MANWKFTDQYGSTYPSLQYSILSLLVFSEHSLNGNDFTGTLDVNATGTALSTIGTMLGMGSIPLSGTVDATGASLTVSLRSTNDQDFTQAIANCIPLIGGSITKNAWLDINTVSSQTDPEGDSPPTDVFNLGVTIAIGSASVDINTQVPMNGGFFYLSGEFTGVGISLNDLNFLMGPLAEGNAWFPSTELGPYSAGQTSFGLLSMSLLCYVTLAPSFSISINSVNVEVGISKLPLMGNALYLDPLGVWVTVTNPTSDAAVTWGLLGSVKLCNYANPGPVGLSDPDFTFDFTMTFPSSTDNTFGIAAYLENPAGKSVNVMLQDLMGQGTNVGIGDNITVNSFEFDTSADVSTGTINEFSTSIVMSGGFGLFEKIPLSVEQLSISVAYSAS
ncbi:MAG: hypothetical protein WAW36_04615 [Methylovulum miyakonense]|uniref:hypothetical protein n=1 Tax=Methylovulum miyakonense TaxID=645578 RepID=UPI003BB7B755